VATVASVPESVGVQFARVFWPRFLAGARLGAALREARLSLLDAGSPLGLLYDLYGRVDTQILGARSQA
jgi:hypothetical protein